MKRCPHRDEQVPGGPRPAVAQVIGDRLAHVGGQRQPGVVIAFAPHRALPGAPVDVIQGEAGDLPGPQAHPGEQDQDRVVAAPGGAVPVAGRQQRGCLPGSDPARKRGSPAAGRRRFGRVQPRPHSAGDVQESEQRAHRGHQALHVGRVSPAGLADGESGDVRRGHGGQVRLAGDAQAGDQRAGEPHVTAHRDCRQPALAGQVAAELRQQRLSRRRGHGSGLRDHAQAPQVAQQRDKGPAAARARYPAARRASR